MVIKIVDKITGKIWYRHFNDYNKYLKELNALKENESLYEIT
jgi:hypothetical protein